MPRTALHPLTSGTTGKPKGIVHTTGGYLVGCYATTKWVFDLKDDDVYWCTADIGWVTGHSYVVYGPLANGVTAADVRRRAQPPADGSVLGDHRPLQGDDLLYRADRHSRVHALGNRVAERRHLARSPAERSGSRSIPKPGCGTTRRSGTNAVRSSILGGKPRPAPLMITPMPGDHQHETRNRHPAVSGVSPVIGDDKGARANRRRAPGITKPWPAMLRGIYGDPERFKQTYFPVGSASISPATAHVETRTASSGRWAAWTTC